MSDEACTTCRRPLPACVCERVVPLATARRVLILQHPQEQDALLGSAQLVVASLPRAQLVIGLSWKNLAHALGEEGVDPRRWAVVFPDREAEAGTVTTRAGATLDATKLDGLIVLDGTWSKAKTLWWRNAWLNKLSRITLAPKEPSIYGRLRAEPKRTYISTLESVGAALTLAGEAPEVEASLRRLFRTLVQRVRDAKLAPDTLRLPKRTRPPRPPRPTSGEPSA
jgi:DTW domain-containing protein YfiP